AIDRAGSRIGTSLQTRGQKTGIRAAALVEHHLGKNASMARTWSTRGMALWVLVLMVGYLLLYYL
ncbi:MAG: hypothetical protein K9K38_06910, partial [Rhodoferax sp.]|nr:hypothetical protein [Rhodoferax sp.]